MIQVVHVMAFDVPKVSYTWKKCYKSNVYAKEINNHQSLNFQFEENKTSGPLPLLLLFYEEAHCSFWQE